MPESNSTPSPRPAKPYPDFPLFPHATKRWCKKIGGRFVYFGTWDEGPEAALARYLEQRDDLHAGRTPRPDPEALSVKQLCNAFLSAKQEAADQGRITPLTWRDYKTACDEIVGAFGKTRLVSDLRPGDFAALRGRMARKWGLQRLCKNIQFIRSAFKWGYEAELIERPVRFGPDFKRPSKAEFRKDRARHGPRLFTADEIRRMSGAATPQLRAMLWLGINCGFGNSDCDNLPLSAVDLDRGVIDFPRPKTGVPRRCVLWPETVQALREALAKRPLPKNPGHAGLVFITRRGDSWQSGVKDRPISHETAKLLHKLHINGRHRLGFYCLRHTFRTIADEARDQPAADYIMGHEIPHMSSVYRERISDERLRAVSDHVRGWLFGAAAG
jgi:integrase